MCHYYVVSLYYINYLKLTYIILLFIMDIDIIQQENNELKEKVKDLEEKLKKYTNGDNHKRYYEKNKDKIKEQGATYLKKLKEDNPEKLKEYRRKYYLKKKEEMQNKDN